MELEVPPNRSYNICMMNEIDKTNRAINFVVAVSEMIAAYNERGLGYDIAKEMDEIYEDEYIGMKNEDLPYALDIFNEDFADPDAGWLYVECKAIRKWIGEKFYA